MCGRGPDRPPPRAHPREGLALSEEALHQVPPEARGTRLDVFLAQRHQDLSRSRIRALIDEGLARVDGKPAKASLRLAGGEEIHLRIPPPAPAEPQPEDLPLRILHEDGELVVLDKAAGVVVHPAPGAPAGTLVNALLFHLKDWQGIGGELRPGIVHRLDRDTSGCLVVAKNERSLRRLQEAFQSRQVEKRYFALVHGVPEPERFTLDTPYGRHPVDRTRYTTRRPAGIERRAITHVRVVEAFGGAAALVEVDLETGRTHQIRVHLSESGHPLLADKVYGGQRREARLPGNSPVRRAAAAVGRQALHAYRLAFHHPASGDWSAFEAPLPQDFQAALDILRQA